MAFTCWSNFKLELSLISYKQNVGKPKLGEWEESGVFAFRPRRVRDRGNGGADARRNKRGHYLEGSTLPQEGFFNCVLFNNIALVRIPFSHYKGSEVSQTIVSRVALHIFWPKDRPIYYLQ